MKTLLGCEASRTASADGGCRNEVNSEKDEDDPFWVVNFSWVILRRSFQFPSDSDSFLVGLDKAGCGSAMTNFNQFAISFLSGTRLHQTGIDFRCCLPSISIHHATKTFQERKSFRAREGKNRLASHEDDGKQNQITSMICDNAILIHNLWGFSAACKIGKSRRLL